MRDRLAEVEFEQHGPVVIAHLQGEVDGSNADELRRALAAGLPTAGHGLVLDLSDAGYLDSALTSGGFMSWGSAGRGRWVTIYAAPGHVYMVVNGRRFDTTGRSESGTRWQASDRSSAGYVVRHPPGL